MKNHYSTPSSERAFLAEGWPRQDLVYKAQLLALSVLEVHLEVLERVRRTRALFPDGGNNLASGALLPRQLAEPALLLHGFALLHDRGLLHDCRLPVGFLRRRRRRRLLFLFEI